MACFSKGHILNAHRWLISGFGKEAGFSYISTIIWLSMKQDLRSFTLCLIVGFFSFTTYLRSQVPQYNTGSSLNGGGNSIPFAYSSSGVRGQGLYPVGVFGSPPSGRAIKKVYWGPYPSSTGSVTYSQLQIYLKQANISSLSTTYETGMTQVFSATSYYLSYTAGIGMASPFLRLFRTIQTFPLSGK